MDKKIKLKDIKQSAAFKASPKDLYELLMDSKKHSAFSGESAKISNKVGGTFSAYGGWIEGKNVKLVKNKLIVQKWRGEDWPDGHYSLVTYKLEKSGSGSKLTFTQKGVSANKCADISRRWKTHYWAKMKSYLGE